MEFLSLEQREGMYVAEYEVQVLTLERFALGCFTREREMTTQFVARLRISIRSVVATFHARHWQRK